MQLLLTYYGGKISFTILHSILSTVLHTYLTYKEIGTNVLRTMAYEKNTKVPIVIDPAILSDGTSESHGK